MDFCVRSIFLHFYWLYPFTKRAITPLSFEQIEKFQCLKSSTTQGLSHGIFRTHVARVTRGGKIHGSIIEIFGDELLFENRCCTTYQPVFMFCACRSHVDTRQEATVTKMIPTALCWPTGLPSPRASTLTSLAIRSSAGLWTPHTGTEIFNFSTNSFVDWCYMINLKQYIFESGRMKSRYKREHHGYILVIKIGVTLKQKTGISSLKVFSAIFGFNIRRGCSDARGIFSPDRPLLGPKHLL